MGRQLLADELAFRQPPSTNWNRRSSSGFGFSPRGVPEAAGTGRGHRPHPVLSACRLALTALWRSYGVPRRGNRSLDGRGRHKMVSGCAEPRRRSAEGDRHSAPGWDGLVVRPGAMALLKSAARDAEEFLADYPERQCGGRGLSPGRSSSPARPTRSTRDRGGGGAGPPGRGASMSMSPPSLDHRSGAGRPAHRTRRPEPAGAGYPGCSSPPAAGRPMAPRSSTRTTGWPTCATRSGSPAAVALRALQHGTFIEIGPNPALTYAIDGTPDRHSPPHRRDPDP